MILTNSHSTVTPPVDPAWLSRALWLVAALLLGAGLVFWVAANWPTQTRQFKLMLLYAAVALPVLGAIALPKLRTAGLLLGTLALGGLLAFVGQTYQTGADAWQLFAAWALLALPWTVLARRDGLWALWVLIVATGVGMWSGQLLLDPIRNWWRDHAGMDWILTLIWLAVACLPLILARWGRLQPTPEPVITLRVTAMMALSAWTTFAVVGIFTSQRGQLLALNVVLILLASMWLWRRRPRDLALLALAVCSVNALILAGVIKLLSSASMGWSSVPMLVFTVVAALCLGVSATWLYRLHRDEVSHDA